MDAEHTREFGAFYRDAVLSPAIAALQERADAAGAPARLDVTIHDVFHFEEPFDVTPEGKVFLAWLGALVPLETFSCWSANDILSPRRAAVLAEVQAAALGDANDIEFGQFPRGDLSARCVFRAEPLPLLEEA
jgi:hypothetical protein